MADWSVGQRSVGVDTCPIPLEDPLLGGRKGGLPRDRSAKSLALPRVRPTWADALYWGSLLGLTVLLLRPLWLVRYPPLGDLPEHAAQIRSILSFDFYRRDYVVNWFTPYLLAYALTMAFAAFMSVTTAIKVVLSLALVGIPLATAALIRALRGNRFWVWTAFPICYSFSFYWGFFSYVVATPVVIAFFAFAVWYARQPLRPRPYALAAAFSLFLFFSHALGWLFAVTLGTVIAMMENRSDWAVKKASAFFAILPLVAYWASASGPAQPPVPFGDHLADTASRVSDIVFFVLDDIIDRVERDLHWDRLQELASLAIGQPAMWDFVALVLLYLSAPLWLGARLSRDWRRYAPLATTVAAYLLVPYWLFGTAYVYERFAVFLIPSSFFAFETAGRPGLGSGAAAPEAQGARARWRRWAGYGASLALVCVMLAETNRTFAAFRENDAEFQAVIEAMKPGKRVLSLIFDQESPLRYSPPYMHFAFWYQAEKLGSVSPSFAESSVSQNSPVPFRAIVERSVPSPWAPGTFDWTAHHGAEYDYFLIRSGASREGLFAKANGAVRLIVRRGPWQLYGRTHEN
jgi:hypothetical protein